MSQVVYQARAYPSFHGMKQLGIFLFSLDGIRVHCRATASMKFTSIDLQSLYTSQVAR